MVSKTTSFCGMGQTQYAAVSSSLISIVTKLTLLVEEVKPNMRVIVEGITYEIDEKDFQTLIAGKTEK